jgi:hypothetical protein
VTRPRWGILEKLGWARPTYWQGFKFHAYPGMVIEARIMGNRSFETLYYEVTDTAPNHLHRISRQEVHRIAMQNAKTIAME